MFKPSVCPHLILRTEAGDRYLPLVNGTRWTFGRDANNDFRIDDPWISRHHAMVQIVGTNQFFLIDLGSHNGSHLNGRRVSLPVLLHGGDLVMLGQTALEFYCPPGRGEDSNSSSYEASATVQLQTRCWLTAVVVDLRNFNGLSRQIDEKLLSEVIGSWFRQASEIISQHSSQIDRYVGDALLAIWQHAEAKATAPGVLAALRAINDLQAMTHSLHNTYPLPFPLQIGVGMNTGEGVVNQSLVRPAMPVPDAPLDSTLKAAFLLESLTQELSVDLALSKTTYQLLLGTNQAVEKFFTPCEVKLKGHALPTIVYASTYPRLQSFLAWVS